MGKFYVFSVSSSSSFSLSYSSSSYICIFYVIFRFLIFFDIFWCTDRQTNRPANLVLEAPCRSLKMRKWSYLRPEVKNEKNKGTLFSSALKVGENWKKYFSYKLKQIYMYISFTFKIPRFAFSNTKDSLCSKVWCWITLFLWVMIQSTKKDNCFQ